VEANMEALNLKTSPDGTILVVDDDASVLTLAAQILRSRGYHVLTAADAPEGVRVAAAYASVIHLLLADVMLGSDSGVDLARAILVKRPETAVLYMSGFSPDTIRASQSEGAPEGAFLEKPFTAETLIDSVRAVVPLPDAHPIPIKLRPRGLPGVPVSDEPTRPAPRLENSDAEYRLESPVKCPQCGEVITALKAVRLLRTQVNFTSTLPRRGRVLICPFCHAIVPAELTNF
jgi:DNA-binding response OmpR family regulator